MAGLLPNPSACCEPCEDSSRVQINLTDIITDIVEDELASLTPVVSLKSEGAKGDGQLLQNAGNMANGSTTLIVTGASFTSSDAGKVLIVGGGDAIGPNAPFYVTTIASVINSTTVNAALAAPQTFTNQHVAWGTDDTIAIQAVFNGLTDAGALVEVPRGFYMVSALTLNKARVSIVGEGGATRFFRASDTSSPLLLVTGEQFQLYNIRVEETLGFNNTAPLVELRNISDSSIRFVWFFGGYDQLKLSFGGNQRLLGNIFESSRHHEVWGFQCSPVLINSNSFYSPGLRDDEPLNVTSAIYGTKEATYTFKPHNWEITGNVFYYSRYAHFINLSEHSGIAITGNTFHLAGMFNFGSKDDIKLAACDDVEITSNTSLSVNNNIIPGNRATRYCVNVSDASCTTIRIGYNAFQPGTLGTFNLQSTDVSFGFGRATAGSVTAPLLSIPNDQVITFRDSSNGVTACGFLRLTSTNIMQVGAGNDSLKGIQIDSSGNGMMGTSTPLGRLTVAGTGVFGTNGRNQLYDAPTVAIFQAPACDWQWYNSTASAARGYLTSAGVFSTNQLCLAAAVPTAPNSSAIADFQSTTQGFLPPRMTTAQRDAIGSPADGLILYNTSTAKLQVRAGGAWTDLH